MSYSVSRHGLVTCCLLFYPVYIVSILYLQLRSRPIRPKNRQRGGRDIRQGTTPSQLHAAFEFFVENIQDARDTVLTVILLSGS